MSRILACVLWVVNAEISRWANRYGLLRCWIRLRGDLI